MLHGWSSQTPREKPPGRNPPLLPDPGPSLSRPGAGRGGTNPGDGVPLPGLSEPSNDPGQLLKSCSAVPELIGTLCNSCSQIPVCQEWAEAVPEEVFQVRQRCCFGRAG